LRARAATRLARRVAGLDGPPSPRCRPSRALSVSAKQRSAIQDAVKDAQSKVVDLQFRMSAEVEKLQRLIQAASPDEPKVLDEVNRVLTLERDMKVAQMTLMVRIKSQLTERQQGLLDQMRGGQPPKPAKE
jgi:Spy/CpxP family protein refolding chaperone